MRPQQCAALRAQHALGRHVQQHGAEQGLRDAHVTPEPRLVVAVGDCGCEGGIFGESYASCGRVANVIPVDAVIRGCPPPPLDILRGILGAVRHRRLQAGGG